MKVLVTGAEGFIGKNLCVHLEERNVTVLRFTRKMNLNMLEDFVFQADSVIHLAGENRPENPKEFEITNVGFTKILCDYIARSNRNISIIFASSTQATLKNAYGMSKFAAEQLLKNLSKNLHIRLAIYRLPGVFGKWCKPNYNSVVATFCHNIANNLPIKINDPDVNIKLVYIDDVINSFVNFISDFNFSSDVYFNVGKEYKIKVGDLADQIHGFKNVRESLVSEEVGTGLTRALYSTYLSYLPVAKFSYPILKHNDDRGDFIEMIKTKDSGQISYFTAHPGVTRGGHYHHTKTEKFLVASGTAKFKFKNIITNEQFELIVNDDNSKVIDTIPGWAHDITNIGDKELVVILWANEIFNPDQPDTYAMSLKQE